MPVLTHSNNIIIIKKTFQKNLTLSLFALFLHSQRKKGMEELVAQLVEQYTFNVWALGSSPSQFTRGVQMMNSFFYA
jgi:hypothetical protein